MKKQTLSILKIGGKILANKKELQKILISFANIKTPKILVHGGGKSANDLCLKLGIQPKMIAGKRVTDAATLEVVTMTYAGLLNKKVVSQLQAFGCNALGLSGADGNVIKARKRPVKALDYGFAGEVTNINSNLIINLLNADITPVFCSITHNQAGQLLNTNADTIASEIANALTANFEVELTFHFEKKGVLSNPEDDDSALNQLSKNDYLLYKKNKIISDGMIPKIDNAFHAKRNGVKQVFIASTEIL
ncbi:MAG: acetylglutamate kinase [Paraglaciecola sp.]|jgi:acetylglutamate kinase